MTDPVDEHLDKAFTSLDDISVRELEATSEALERRKESLRHFASFFRHVARHAKAARGPIFLNFTFEIASPEPTRISPSRSRRPGTVLAPLARCPGRAASVTPAALPQALRPLVAQGRSFSRRLI